MYIQAKWYKGSAHIPNAPPHPPIFCIGFKSADCYFNLLLEMHWTLHIWHVNTLSIWNSIKKNCMILHFFIQHVLHWVLHKNMWNFVLGNRNIYFQKTSGFFLLVTFLYIFKEMVRRKRIGINIVNLAASWKKVNQCVFLNQVHQCVFLNKKHC